MSGDSGAKQAAQEEPDTDEGYNIEVNIVMPVVYLSREEADRRYQKCEGGTLGFVL